MRAINVSVGSDGQSHKTVSTNHNLFEERKESRSGIKQRSASAYQPNALPLGQTGSPSATSFVSTHGASVTSTETIRLIRDGGATFGEEGDYIPATPHHHSYPALH